MAYTNAHLCLELGNVVSRIRGPAPNDALDRVLNPHAQATGTGWDHDPGRQALVYESPGQTFLTGALEKVETALRAQGCPFRVVDLRADCPRVHDWRLRGVTLRDFQEEVVDKAIERGTGTIDLGTSGGKTILAAAIIARLGLPAIYLVTTRTLLHQTVESLRRLLGFEPGVIGDGVRRPGPLTVAIAQAMTGGSERTGRWKNGVLVWDEGHHAAAPSYLELIKQVDARFNFFLSAVPYRAGDDQIVLDSVTGGTLTDGEFSARYLIERGYACPVEVQIEHATSDQVMVEQPFWKIYRECIVTNGERNRRITEIARDGIVTGESILILVERVQHGRLLEERIGAATGADAAEARTSTGATADARAGAHAGTGADAGTDAGAGPVVGFAHGSLPKTILREMTEAFATGALPCLVATVGLFNEGISIHGITVLVNAGGMKSRGKMLQAVGRGMRQSPGRGKTRCLFVDFFDDDPVGVLRAHSRQRMEVLMDEGFRVPRVVDGRTGGRTQPGPHVPTTATDDAWGHIPNTRNFVRVTAEGRVVARGECMRKERVPASLCKRCQQPWVCQRGGVVTWQILD